MDWFLYHNGPRHERVKLNGKVTECKLNRWNWSEYSEKYFMEKFMGNYYLREIDFETKLQAVCLQTIF